MYRSVLVTPLIYHDLEGEAFFFNNYYLDTDDHAAAASRRFSYTDNPCFTDQPLLQLHRRSRLTRLKGTGGRS
jgi:hypothetical protein